MGRWGRLGSLPVKTTQTNKKQTIIHNKSTEDKTNFIPKTEKSIPKNTKNDEKAKRKLETESS